MPRLLCLLALFLAFGGPVAGQENLSDTPEGSIGTAARLVLAQRAWQHGLATGELLPMLAAIRQARSITLRPATGWERATTEGAPTNAPTGRTAAPDPASDAALAIMRNLAGDDPGLQDLVYDLDAQLPRERLETASVAGADLAPGQTDSWRMALFGEVATELAVIGDTDGPLQLTLQDASGATLCATPPSPGPALCRITPARNGFFTLTVHNPGMAVNSYRLIGN